MLAVKFFYDKIYYKIRGAILYLSKTFIHVYFDDKLFIAEVILKESVWE